MSTRQALGQGVLGCERGRVEDRRKTFNELLTEVLRILLPATAEEKVQSFVTKITDRCIALRDAMTAEQAIYRCVFVERGRNGLDDNYLRVVDGDQATGSVLMCTFPGLLRLTVRDSQKEFVPVVKVDVKMEGIVTFKKQTEESSENKEESATQDMTMEEV